jgi:hypothetical protein
MKKWAMSASDPDFRALLALHRGEVRPAAKYLRGWLKRIQKSEPYAPMSCLYALADILDAAPNAFHHVKLITNRKMTRLDANLKAVLEIGRYASETPRHGDAAAEKFSIARSTAYELEAEYKRYQRADEKGKPFKLIKRPSKVPTKRRGRAGIKPIAIAE